MSWINARQFQIANYAGRHYVYHRNNTGRTEINIPSSITTKAAAVRWLKDHPEKMPRPKPKIGPFLKPVFIPVGQNFPTRPQKPYSPSPEYGKAPSPPKYSCTGKKLTKIIGKGRQGIIYKGDGFAAKVCPRDLRAARHKEKQPAKVEFDIQQAAHTSAPHGVVDVFWIEKCKNFIPPSAMNMANVQDPRSFDKSEQTVIFMEYCSGGSLSGWLNEKPRTDAMLHHLIKSVTTTLAKIQKDYPYFRHNDLHLENVFVSDRGFLIGDFGWARIKKTGTNPAVNTANKTGIAGKWGVGPNTDPRYDHHMFLNNLRAWVVDKGGFPAARAFLDVAVPPGYRGPVDAHVQEWRLKYNDPCPGLPSLNQILKSKYITGRKFNSPNLVAARAKLRKVVVRRVPKIRSANLVAARAKLRKSKPSARRISVGNIRRARNKLKPARPRAKITANMLKARKSKLKARKITKKRITVAMLKNKRFDKLIEYIWKNNGSEPGNNAWSKARDKAIRLVELRMNMGNAPFSLSPPKKVPIPPKKVPKKVPTGSNFKISPGSKRLKILNPETGRMVYANGPSVTLQYLQNLAARRGVNIKGLRAKNAIARKIFT
jgi:serine/threonine protein kinase